MGGAWMRACARACVWLGVGLEEDRHARAAPPQHAATSSAEPREVETAPACWPGPTRARAGLSVQPDGGVSAWRLLCMLWGGARNSASVCSATPAAAAPARDTASCPTDRHSRRLHLAQPGWAGLGRVGACACRWAMKPEPRVGTAVCCAQPSAPARLLAGPRRSRPSTLPQQRGAASACLWAFNACSCTLAPGWGRMCCTFTRTC